MPKPQLDALAMAARSGGRKEMNRFMAELRPLICRWALVWCGDPDDAEDAAQRVLVKIHRSLERYEPRGSFMSWAYRTTRNVLIDLDRESRSRDALRAGARLGELAAEVPRPLDPVRRDAARRILKRLMETLSPQQRSILDLVELQGFTASEVGEMMEISPSTVRVHLHRARNALRDQGSPSDTERVRSHG